MGATALSQSGRIDGEPSVADQCFAFSTLLIFSTTDFGVA